MPSPVADTLQGAAVHNQWIDRYRQPDNEPFYRWAFDLIAGYLPRSGTILDAGCGTGTKTVHLVSRGFDVLGVDVSQRVVEAARLAVPGARFAAADLTELRYADGHFAGVVCWGVLMHVPDVTSAFRELVRVTKPGGVIVMSENNARSLHFRALSLLKRLRPRVRDIRHTPAGIETWEQTPDGVCVTRYADPRWLIAEAENHGCELLAHRAGEFSQAYAMTGNKRLRAVLHSLNALWYRYVRAPRLSEGQLLVFRKAA